MPLHDMWMNKYNWTIAFLYYVITLGKNKIVSVVGGRKKAIFDV